MVKEKFSLSSPAFEEGKAMPSKYAYRGVTGGQNVSVPLRWDGPPGETLSFALACIDLHPIANNWVHWLVVNISKQTREVPDGASGSGRMPGGSLELINGYGGMGYGGPQPPKGSGRHKYQFTLYALNIEKLEISATSSLSSFLTSISGKVLSMVSLIGTFEQ